MAHAERRGVACAPRTVLARCRSSYGLPRVQHSPGAPAPSSVSRVWRSAAPAACQERRRCTCARLRSTLVPCSVPLGAVWRARRAPCAPAWRCWRWQLRLPARWRRVAAQCQTRQGCQRRFRRTRAARPAASARSSSSTRVSSAATSCTANMHLRRAGRCGSARVSWLGYAPLFSGPLTLLPRAQDCPSECEVSWDMAREPEAAAGTSRRKSSAKRMPLRLRRTFCL